MILDTRKVSCWMGFHTWKSERPLYDELAYCGVCRRWAFGWEQAWARISRKRPRAAKKYQEFLYQLPPDTRQLFLNLDANIAALKNWCGSEENPLSENYKPRPQ